MKKKMLIICVVMMLAVGVWGLTRPEALGNITRDFAEPTTSTSTISFSGEENDKIKFVFKSDVKGGELNIVLSDSNGNVVYEVEPHDITSCSV